MGLRVVVGVLVPVVWSPPGVGVEAWRAALAEDVVDLLARVAQAEPAVAAVRADLELARGIVWPGMRIYEVPGVGVRGVLEAAAADGFEQGAVVAGDAADLPGMILGKLLRPLSSKAVAVAPSDGDGGGLLGVAARLPLPEWVEDFDLDTASVMSVRKAAPRASDVESTTQWRRLRGAGDLARLDPALEGWEMTRALLGG